MQRKEIDGLLEKHDKFIKSVIDEDNCILWLIRQRFFYATIKNWKDVAFIWVRFFLLFLSGIFAGFFVGYACAIHNNSVISWVSQTFFSCIFGFLSMHYVFNSMAYKRAEKKYRKIIGI